MKNLKEAFAKLLTGINVKSFDKEYSGDMYDLISFGKELSCVLCLSF